jgi:acetyltransferase-like isoleucine patch superfamily enzyme
VRFRHKTRESQTPVNAYLKTLIRGLSFLAVSPLIALDTIVRVATDEGLFASCAQLLSLIPGKTGSYLRIAFYRHTMSYCAPDCFIGFGTLFSQRDTQIGSGVYIGPQCNIGACRIGNDTLIASGVHIMSGNGQHRFDDLETPIREQGGQYKPVTIGEDCWIGNAVLVMADIGDKVIVGAGSVVTQPIEAYAIAVGNPARVLRSRKDDA